MNINILKWLKEIPALTVPLRSLSIRERQYIMNDLEKTYGEHYSSIKPNTPTQPFAPQ